MRTLRLNGIAVIAVFISLMAQKGYAVPNIKAGEKAASSWLTLIDSEKYPEAWKGFSTFFKERMTQAKWEEQIKSARSIFGKLVERKHKSAVATQTLPGAADGDYVVVQYDTAFEKKKNALETVTVILEKDGKWGVVGYYIK